MGHVMHHTIVVTSWNEQLVAKAREEASRLGLSCTGTVESPVNGYWTFCVVPDGSKSGWADDEQGDIDRSLFKAWMAAQVYPDGGNALEWFEACYGNDEREATITASTWQAAATPAPSALERVRERVRAVAECRSGMGQYIWDEQTRAAMHRVLGWIDEEREREAKR